MLNLFFFWTHLPSVLSSQKSTAPKSKLRAPGALVPTHPWNVNLCSLLRTVIIPGTPSQIGSQAAGAHQEIPEVVAVLGSWKAVQKCWTGSLEIGRRGREAPNTRMKCSYFWFPLYFLSSNTHNLSADWATLRQQPSVAVTQRNRFFLSISSAASQNSKPTDGEGQGSGSPKLE